jgi:hypothetical protein
VTAPSTVVRFPPAQQRQLADAYLATINAAKGCPHLVGAGIACLLHPGVIRCHRCAKRHLATHTHAEEFVCDVCYGPLDGADGDTWHVGVMQPVPVNLDVSLGRGRRSRLHMLILLGFGACWSCHVDMSIATHLEPAS